MELRRSPRHGQLPTRVMILWINTRSKSIIITPQGHVCLGICRARRGQDTEPLPSLKDATLALGGSGQSRICHGPAICRTVCPPLSPPCYSTLAVTPALLPPRVSFSGSSFPAAYKLALISPLFKNLCLNHCLSFLWPL